RRMVVAAAKDLRVLIIKLADRLHNMQTLYAKRRPKQIKIARETEVIYAKLADRLGIWRIKWEMEDLAFRYLEPEAYFEIERRVAKTRDERMAEIDAAVGRIRKALGEEGVEAEVYGRPKHLYSIYNKMRRQGIDFDEIYDLEAIRIITDTVWHCYKALYIVHSLWPHQPEHFADYISNPKANGYRSIHTKVVVPGHGPMEIQIRTADMHRQAEYGVAAHWRYKDEGGVDETFAHKLTMLRKLFDMARESGPVSLPDQDGKSAEEVEEFLQEVQSSLWDEEVFVFSPKGEVIDLPKGATVVDFAYRIHTEIGHTCIGARVNRRMVPLDFQLHNGDQVEIIRQRNTGPSRDWLKFVQTAAARNRIRQYFRQKERDTLIERGQQALEQEAERQRVDLKELYRRDRELPAAHRRRHHDQPVEELLTRVARRRSYNTDDDLLTAIGDGVISAEGVVRQMVLDIEEASRAAGLARPLEPEPSDVIDEPRREASASIQGITNLMMRRSKCCLPLPGDEIVGYITRGAGIAIHRVDCANVRHLKEKEADRVVPLNWEQTEHMLYDVPIEIRANDRIGLLRDLTQLMSDVGVNILKINTISPRLHKAGTDHLATIRMSLELVDRTQLEQLIRRMPPLGVVKVTLRGQVFLDSEKGTRGRAARRAGSRRRTPSGD
ncbi:MAG: bifunctional (p)ppGpp synthetase/guanosine-3',5'-bis(diphosphate) 3'-pyrophosphohydrolase, partial [Armatimonadetes bacterium]|nr:bifunctional (p)ppGpp synthetase/guanosine-3',5'-bis(diphosphate) 3'-pyrophosphohydrolase [Armatimonadota bacterium]